MTDSLKFGPEWLRNMSSDNSGSGAGSGGTTGSNNSGSGTTNTSLATSFLLPRFQQAEYRYGREEMLSLCDKDMKLPEILPNFKKLYVEKEQLPLALSPSTEDEGVYQFPPPRSWQLRSTISLAPPPRLGRGGSVDRGRGRPRIGQSISFPARPPFDENQRGGGRGVDRGWPERNGGADVGGSGDWNGSPSSSPRKEYNSHGRTSGMENWRRRGIEDESGDGWRSSNLPAGYRWSRSTSWRDDETNPFLNSSASSSASLSSGMVPITRSLSSSASMGHGSAGSNVDRASSMSSNGPVYKQPPPGSNSHELERASGESVARTRSDRIKNTGNENSSAEPSKTHPVWDQEDIPEWAMDNAADGGGSFDASGAFHVPDDDEDSCADGLEIQSNRTPSDHHIDPNRRSANGRKAFSSADNSDGRQEIEASASDVLAKETIESDLNPSATVTKKSDAQKIGGPSHSNVSQPPKEPSHSTSLEGSELSPRGQKNQESSQIFQNMQHKAQISQNIRMPALPIFQSAIDNSSSKNQTSDIADRMQEVDDMVEKLIMEDEMSANSPAGTSSNQTSLIKSSVTSTSPTGIVNPLLALPSLQVHGHPIMVPPPQPPPTPSNELWYYRDPQNKIQGPFTGAEMAEWYRSDYFDENLFVRRVCDSRFATLGELVKMCGNSMPFLSSHLIPPLPMIPAMPLSNQTSSVVPPGPPPINMQQSKPINIVNPLLNTNEVVTLQLQVLQKEYLMRQQRIIYSKLSASEQFVVLAPERQQQIIQQHMAQVSLPDNIVNLPAFINFLHGGVNPPQFSMQQILPTSNAKTDLNQVKLASSHNPFMNAGGPTEMPGIPPMHPLMPSANVAQAIVPPPQPVLPKPSASADDQMKAFLQHFQASKTMPQNVNNVYTQNVLSGLQQMSWLGGSNTSIGGPASMWDFDPMANKVYPSIKPEMKTEQQILEEQRLQQQQIQPETPNLSSSEMISSSNQAPPMLANQQKASISQQPPPPSQPVNDQNQLPQKIHQSSLQQQRPSKKAEEKTRVYNEEIAKPGKGDDVKKQIKTSKSDKKEAAKPIKPNEEDRKREMAEERKRQKEEKKKQLMEEERKRQQSIQEEEKRRQVLEEKKRQEEIDRHRRAKMLENVSAKNQKSSNESSRSSVAPWLNTSAPKASSPAASLAEIQKAERERRTEERLELMNQRKIQQMEMLSKVESTVTWNAPLISVKSLAEIQAEEQHKHQQVPNEPTVASVVQKRKKDDLSSLQTTLSVVANSTTASTVGVAHTSSMGSIWSSWNGKPAWTSTSNAGFWEEPVKIPANTGSSASTTNAKQTSLSSSATGGNNNRILSKSQTFANIQTTVKNNQSSSGSGGNSGSDSKPASNTSAMKLAKNTTNKIGKVSSSNSTGSSHQNNCNNKKDDARNEFTSWCIKALSSMKSTVDVPTFIQFLQDIESPYEVKDYIRIYLGETKECTEFAKQFLERRSKYKNQQRALNAHIDDMCSPAPAINPSTNDFQEVKGKSKKVKKGKMTKLDARILGFSVTAAQDRINVGDRDYGDTA